MNQKRTIPEADFDSIQTLNDIHFINEHVAFHRDITKLTQNLESIRLNMFSITACKRGYLQTEINGTRYTIQKNEILLLKRNDIMVNTTLSPDFVGSTLWLNPDAPLEHFTENELWERLLYFSKNPVLAISKESMHMLTYYVDAIKNMQQMTPRPFHNEITMMLVRIILYELLSNVDYSYATYFNKTMTNQQEALFRKFIRLISHLQIKQRHVSWYADELCVTPKYLSTICKQVSKKTAFQWINEYVCSDIRHWLKNTDKSIKEVAELLNFPNMSFFGNYCRKHFGASPSTLRCQLRQEQLKVQEK
ncbi:MAG: helix-turn-helix domain-containing protein [Prevotella sp.]